MRPLMMATPLLLVSACTTDQVSNSALCHGLRKPVDRLATSLLGPDVPDAVVVNGERVVAKVDAGCPT